MKAEIPYAPYLVLRVVNTDGKNIADELDSVIAKSGYAWFGKYGHPLGRRAAEKERRFLVLVGRSSQGEMEVFKTYAITAFSFARPQDGAYPYYYNRSLELIRTWIRVEKAECHDQVGIDDLVVSSTSSRLSDVFRKSMASQCFCFRKASVPAVQRD